MNNSSNTDYVIEDFDNMEISTNNNATSNDTVSSWLNPRLLIGMYDIIIQFLGYCES